MGTGITHPARKKTVILQIAPETGRLTRKMGPLAAYISGKSGGMGDVVAALCEGLTNRGIECHLATLNLSSRFQQENQIDEDQWHKITNTIDPDRIHLVNSAVFSNLSDAYSGNPVVNAAEFQKAAVNQIIPRIRATNGGRVIIHSHDWMAGGIITAYAKMSGCPVLHTFHNSHTGHIPLDLLFGIDTARLSDYLYGSTDQGKQAIDCHATAIKNASFVNFVGARFLRGQELTLSDDGAPQDSGNGFLFRDYDAGGLWYGLNRTVQFHRLSPSIRERQIKRIMTETRQKYNLEKMVDRYVDLYETLNDGITRDNREST